MARSWILYIWNGMGKIKVKLKKVRQQTLETQADAVGYPREKRYGNVRWKAEEIAHTFFWGGANCHNILKLLSFPTCYHVRPAATWFSTRTRLLPSPSNAYLYIHPVAFTTSAPCICVYYYISNILFFWSSLFILRFLYIYIYIYSRSSFQLHLNHASVSLQKVFQDEIRFHLKIIIKWVSSIPLSISFPLCVYI